MVMTDVSGTVKRADALGKLGVSYGVGMIIGPTVGGFVTTYFNNLLATDENQGVGERYAAALAAAICVVAIVIVLMFVPRTTKDPKRIAAVDSKEAKVFGKRNFWSLVSVNPHPPPPPSPLPRVGQCVQPQGGPLPLAYPCRTLRGGDQSGGGGTCRRLPLNVHHCQHGEVNSFDIPFAIILS